MNQLYELVDVPKTILESRARVFSRSNGENRAYYASKKAQLPFVMVMVNGEVFHTIELTKAGKAAYEAIAVKRYNANRGGEPVTPEEDEFRQMISKYVLGIADDFTPYQPDFKVQQHDRTSLFKSLMNTYRIPPSTLTTHYGDMPEFDDNIQHGDTVIIPSPNMGAKSLQLVKQSIDGIDAALKPFGLHQLVAGNYRITKLTGAAANYHYGKGLVSLDIAGLRKGSAHESLIHELGHKWDDVVNLGEVIIKKFNELRSKGHRFTGTPKLETGQVLNILKPPKYTGIDYTITRVSSDGVVASYQIDGERGTVTIPLRMIQMSSDVVNADGSAIEMINGDDWFITAYAETSHRELFAELFVEYIQGRSAPEVSEWFSSLPKP
jgi:hypothetical protein